MTAGRLLGGHDRASLLIRQAVHFQRLTLPQLQRLAAMA